MHRALPDLLGRWPVHPEKKSDKDLSVQSPDCDGVKRGSAGARPGQEPVRPVGPWAVLQQENCSGVQIRARENEESLSLFNIFVLRLSCTNCPSAASSEVLKSAQMNRS